MVVPLERRPHDVTGPRAPQSASADVAIERPDRRRRPAPSEAAAAADPRRGGRRRGRGRRGRGGRRRRRRGRGRADDAEATPRRPAGRRRPTAGRSPSRPPTARRRAGARRLLAAPRRHPQALRPGHARAALAVAGRPRAGTTALRVQPGRPRPPRRRRRRPRCGSTSRPRQPSPSRSCPTPACRGAPPSVAFNQPAASAAADLIDADRAGHRRPAWRRRDAIVLAADPLLVGRRRPRGRPHRHRQGRSSCFAFLLVADDADGLVRAQGHRRHAEPHRPEPGRAVRASSRPWPTASSSSSRRTCIPDRADRLVFRLAPVPVAASPRSSSFAIVPIGGDFTDGERRRRSRIFGHDTYLQLADPPIGILFVLAMSSIAVYGDHAGRLVVGLEVPAARLGAGVGPDGVLRGGARPVGGRRRARVAARLSTHGIVRRSQARARRTGTSGHPASCRSSSSSSPAPPSSNRPPFDLVEAEQELVGGFHTEYASIRFAHLLPGRVHEHDHDVGDHRHAVPRRPDGPALVRSRLASGARSGSSLKLLRASCSCFVWFRATLPRFRYDQLMDLGWKLLIPLVARLAAAARRRSASATTQDWNPVARRRRRRRRARSPATALLALRHAAPPRRAPDELEEVVD